MARILEITGLAGAYATRLLAEAGHSVIRLERGEGDSLRNLPPFLGALPEIESSCYHQFLNAGKRSATLSLAASAGRVLDRYLNILPTVTIREGFRIKVYLTNDLDLPVYAAPNSDGGVR